MEEWLSDQKHFVIGVTSDREITAAQLGSRLNGKAYPLPRPVQLPTPNTHFSKLTPPDNSSGAVLAERRTEDGSLWGVFSLCDRGRFYTNNFLKTDSFIFYR